MQSSSTERRVLGAVARHFGVSWEWCDTASVASVTVAGRRIAVEVLSVTGRDRGGATPTVRLRDDRVARRFLSELDAAVGAQTPDGGPVILTLGAPIKVPNRTLAALTQALSDRLACGIVDRDESMDVLGNRVRFRILSDSSGWTGKVIGFVFTGDPNPEDLAGALRSLQSEISARARACTPDRFAGDWWLALAGGDRTVDIDILMRGLRKLSVPDRFAKILAVRKTGRVAELAPLTGRAAGIVV